MADSFREHAGEDVLRAQQLCTGLDAMPVEDAPVLWDEMRFPIAKTPYPPRTRTARRAAYSDDVPPHNL